MRNRIVDYRQRRTRTDNPWNQKSGDLHQLIVEWVIAILGMVGLAILGVGGFVWGMTRRVDALRDQAEKGEERALDAANSLLSRKRGRDLLRSLRGGR
jgi:type IV secretory pathway TrbF-like protein